MPQTTDAVRGTWDASESAVVGFLQPQSYTRRIVLMAVQGPAASVLTIYRGYGTTGPRLTRVYPGDDRTYDAGTGDAPITVFGGEACTYTWTGGAAGTGATASATVVSQWGED